MHENKSTYLIALEKQLAEARDKEMVLTEEVEMAREMQVAIAVRMKEDIK